MFEVEGIVECDSDIAVCRLSMIGNERGGLASGLEAHGIACFRHFQDLTGWNAVSNMHINNRMVGHPRCVFINYIWLNQLSNTTNLWWIDVYYIVINYMFRRLWPSSGCM